MHEAVNSLIASGSQPGQQAAPQQAPQSYPHPMHAQQGMQPGYPQQGQMQPHAHGQQPGYPQPAASSVAQPMHMPALEPARTRAPMAGTPAMLPGASVPRQSQADLSRKPSIFNRMTAGLRNAVTPGQQAPQGPQNEPQNQSQMRQAPHSAAPVPAPMPAPAPAPYQAPVRAAFEAHEPPRPAVRAAHAEDFGMDIPAFLRRQQS